MTIGDALELLLEVDAVDAAQEDAQRHLEDAERHAELHLERVAEEQLVLMTTTTNRTASPRRAARPRAGAACQHEAVGWWAGGWAR